MICKKIRPSGMRDIGGRVEAILLETVVRKALLNSGVPRGRPRVGKPCG